MISPPRLPPSPLPRPVDVPAAPRPETPERPSAGSGAAAHTGKEASSFLRAPEGDDHSDSAGGMGDTGGGGVLLAFSAPVVPASSFARHIRP